MYQHAALPTTERVAPTPPPAAGHATLTESLGNRALLDLLLASGESGGVSAQGMEPISAGDENLHWPLDSLELGPYRRFATDDASAKIEFGLDHYEDDRSERSLCAYESQAGAWWDEDGDACVGGGASFTGFGVDTWTADKEGVDPWLSLGGAFGTAGTEAVAGTDGVRLGAGVNLAEGHLGGGTGYSDDRWWDSSFDLEASVGVGASAGLCWDDKDGDGIREIGGHLGLKCIPGLEVAVSSELLGLPLAPVEAMFWDWYGGEA